jgi:hypothetical protein
MDKTVEPETSGPKLQIQSAQDEKSSERTLNAKPTIPKALVNIPANDAWPNTRTWEIVSNLSCQQQI